jgi:hypothetical protein
MCCACFWERNNLSHFLFGITLYFLSCYDHRPRAGARAMLPINREADATVLIEVATKVERIFSVTLVVFMVNSFY